MPRPRRQPDVAAHHIQVRLTAAEMAALDAKRQAGESRSDAVRRLLGVSEAQRPSPGQGLAMALLSLVDGTSDPASGNATVRAELLLGALTRMGFGRPEAERAVALLGPRLASAPLGDLVREAVRLMPREEGEPGPGDE